MNGKTLRLLCRRRSGAWVVQPEWRAKLLGEECFEDAVRTGLRLDSYRSKARASFAAVVA